MSQDFFDELSKGLANAKLSRRQLLKGLGAGLLLMGSLPFVDSKRAEAQSSFDWTAISSVKGTISFTWKLRYTPFPSYSWNGDGSYTGTINLDQVDFDDSTGIVHCIGTATRSGSIHLDAIDNPDHITLDGSVIETPLAGGAELHIDTSKGIYWLSIPSLVIQATLVQIDLTGQNPPYTSTEWVGGTNPTNGRYGPWGELNDIGGGQGVTDSSTLPDKPPLAGAASYGQVDLWDDLAPEWTGGLSSFTWSLDTHELLPEIPNIMRHFGWLNGARLQDIWFSGPAREVGKDFDPKSPTAPADTNTIKMDSFVLTFPRAKAAYDKLIQQDLWNDAAQAEIEKLLNKKGLLITEKRSFGNLDAPVQQQDQDYVQYASVSYGLDDIQHLDDMVCALGRFTLRAVVAGYVEPLTGVEALYDTHKVTVTDVGVYVRDSFDFEDGTIPQFLGYWFDDPPYADATSPGNSGKDIWNSSYRDWRKKHGQGGDFLVFSDVKKTTLTEPEIFYVKATGFTPPIIKPPGHHKKHHHNHKHH